MIVFGGNGGQLIRQRLRGQVLVKASEAFTIKKNSEQVIKLCINGSLTLCRSGWILKLTLKRCGILSSLLWALKVTLCPRAILGVYLVSTHLFTLAMGCIGGADASKGSTPKAALIVTDEINTDTAKNARVSASGDSFIWLQKKVC
jgi:hypothetical protein